jgi:hypothetical protein
MVSKRGKYRSNKPLQEVAIYFSVDLPEPLFNARWVKDLIRAGEAKMAGLVLSTAMKKHRQPLQLIVKRHLKLCSLSSEGWAMYATLQKKPKSRASS